MNVEHEAKSFFYWQRSGLAQRLSCAISYDVAPGAEGPEARKSYKLVGQVHKLTVSDYQEWNIYKSINDTLRGAGQAHLMEGRYPDVLAFLASKYPPPKDDVDVDGSGATIAGGEPTQVE